MNNRYHVKWQHRLTGQTCYGVFLDPNYNKGAYKNIPDGFFVVDNAITPAQHTVRDEDLVDIDSDEYYQFIEAEHQKAQAISEALPDGVYVGALLTDGVGDGYAWYVVTKVNKKTCHIEWRGFSPDRYVSQHWGYGKSVPIADIEPFVESERWRTGFRKNRCPVVP